MCTFFSNPNLENKGSFVSAHNGFKLIRPMTSITRAHVSLCLDTETDRKQMSVEVNVNHLKLMKAVRF